METDNHRENLLSSIRSNERAQANSFFFARIQARMQHREAATTPFFLRPAVVLPGIALLLFFNVMTIMVLSKASKMNTEASFTAQLEQQYFSDQSY